MSDRAYDIVCFDCDSTLSRVEGIDELARRVGVEDEIVPLTDAAMSGELTIDEVYGRRMELVRPDRAAIDWLAQLYIEQMTPGAASTIDALRRCGKTVHIISGGLLPAIVPLADKLGLPVDNVHAVDVYFDEHGKYAGFESASPLTRSEGKAEIVRRLSSGDLGIAMVGDGLTDVAAAEAGAFVVGFGGIVARKAVAESAHRFVSECDLSATLAFLLSECERASLRGDG